MRSASQYSPAERDDIPLTDLHPDAHAASAPAPPTCIQTLLNLGSARRKPNIAFHFVALMIKNFHQKRRAWKSTCFEMLLPCIFVIGLAIIWVATNDSNTSTTTFIQSLDDIPLTNTEGVAAGLLCVNSSVTDVALLGLLSPCNATSTTVCSGTAHPYIPAPPANANFSRWANGFKAVRYVPSFNERVLWNWVGVLSDPDSDDRTRLSSSASSAGMCGGYIHFVPRSDLVTTVINYLDATYPLFKYTKGQTFTSAEDARSYATNEAHAGTTWAVLGINKASVIDGLDFVIHMNRSAIPSTTTITAAGQGAGSFSTALYMASGFLTLQDSLNAFFRTQIIRNDTTLPRSSALIHIPMPFPGFDTSTFLTTVGTLATIFLVFGYMYPVSQMIRRIVEEKEKRQRESMMIMGLHVAPFYGSWVTLYFIIQVGTSLGCALILTFTLFSKSNFAIIWALYFMFGVSSIAFSCLLAAIFSKTRVATFASPVLFFLAAVPVFALQDAPMSTLLFISLLSPTAFSQGMNNLVNFEIADGLHPSDLGESFNGYSTSLALFMLVFDTVLYLLLALYLDQVLPSEWGSRKHPLFCFLWCCRKTTKPSDITADGRDPTGVFEPDPATLRPSIALRGLRKEFDDPAGGAVKMVAVRDLTLNMYEGQIVALLGHNGAGKTTAISLMTGMLTMDTGDCFYDGKSVAVEAHKVRREIGFCPQHNILWSELTCREHLHFFARLKGLNADQRHLAVEAALEAVDLLPKGDSFPDSLSGGQKRKLSIAIAFVGAPKVIFLDEPTAGMDVDARRHTWDLIRYLSPGRTIVLTTHYMEEADLLGHTVSIMSKGRLKCSGSSVFLKSRLGVGYNLTLNCRHDIVDMTPVISAVQHYVPEASVVHCAPPEASLRLPFSAVARFPSLLSYLEESGHRVGITAHGISVTTLEEIFIKLADDESHRPTLPQQQVPLSGIVLGTDPGFSTPLGTVSAGLSPSWTGEVAQQATAVNVPAADSSAIWTQATRASAPSWSDQVTSLLRKRFAYSRRDRRTIFMQIVLPVLDILIALGLNSLRFSSNPLLYIEPAMYTSGTVSSLYGNCPAGWASYTASDTASFNVGATNPLNFSNELLATYHAHSRNRVGSYVCEYNMTDTSSAAFMYTNTSIYLHSAPEALWELRTAEAQYELGQKVKSRVASWPLPLTDREESTIAGFQALFVALFVMIPFTFVPSTFVSFIVKEREVKILQLQRTAGLHYRIYWFANFLFDIVSFFITAGLVIVVFLIFGRDEYVGSDTFFPTFLLFVFYGAAGAGGAYVMSFLFETHGSAQNVVMIVNLICGFVLVFVQYILNLISSTQTAAQVLRYFFRVVPSYCLGEGILNLANRKLQSSYSESSSAFAMDVVGWPILYLAFEVPLLMALTLYIDSPLRKKQQRAVTHLLHHQAERDALGAEDSDVAAERRDVESGHRQASDVVIVKNMRKVYDATPPVVAVKNLSFGVHRGEVFGFLGTNGAGKTTVISILSGEFEPSSGSGSIAGYDVVEQGELARQVIGYCPQFDATLDLLNADDHLNLFASLRGITGNARTTLVDQLIRLSGLQEHRAKPSKSLSGGNRRKLSVALALIGAPQVVFLDEPSAGMDPVARRNMFELIRQVAMRASVVLTTHHLEEVEALCNRVGIMVSGELKCIGPLQHLKSKFGSGFEMTIRVDRIDKVQDLMAFISARIPQAVLQEERGTKLTYALPQSTRLSQVFALIEGSRAALCVTDYSVSQTSLESVFLRISAEAKSHSNDVQPSS